MCCGPGQECVGPKDPWRSRAANWVNSEAKEVLDVFFEHVW